MTLTLILFQKYHRIFEALRVSAKFVVLSLRLLNGNSLWMLRMPKKFNKILVDFRIGEYN